MIAKDQSPEKNEAFKRVVKRLLETPPQPRKIAGKGYVKGGTGRPKPKKTSR